MKKTANQRVEATVFRGGKTEPHVGEKGSGVEWKLNCAELHGWSGHASYSTYELLLLRWALS